MKVKNVVIVLSIGINIVLGVLFYNETAKKDPVDVGLAFKEAVRVEDYSLARTLIAEGRNEQIPEHILEKVHEIMSPGASFHTYELLAFDNGERCCFS